MALASEYVCTIGLAAYSQRSRLLLNSATNDNRAVMLIISANWFPSITVFFKQWRPILPAEISIVLFF